MNLPQASPNCLICMHFTRKSTVIKFPSLNTRTAPAYAQSLGHSFYPITWVFRYLAWSQCTSCCSYTVYNLYPGLSLSLLESQRLRCSVISPFPLRAKVDCNGTTVNFSKFNILRRHHPPSFPSVLYTWWNQRNLPGLSTLKVSGSVPPWMGMLHAAFSFVKFL